MSDLNISTDRQRALIDRLRELTRWRAAREAGIRARESAVEEQASAEFAERDCLLRTQFEDQSAALVAAYEASREAIFCAYETAGFQLLLEEQADAATAGQNHEEALESAKMLCQHKSRQVLATFKEQSVLPKAEFARFKQQCQLRAGEIDSLWADAQAIVGRRGPWPDNGPPRSISFAPATPQAHLDRFSAALAEMAARREAFLKQPAARFVEDGWPVLIFFLSLPAVIYPLWLLFGATGGWGWVAASCLLLSLGIAVLTRQAALPFARQQTLQMVPDFERSTAIARAELAAAVESARSEGERRYRELVTHRDRDLKEARADWKRVRRQEKTDYQSQRQYAEHVFQQRRKAIEEEHEGQFAELEANYPPQLARLKSQFAQQTAELRQQHESRLATDREQFGREWNELQTTWASGWREFDSPVSEMRAYCDAHFPPWDEVAAKAQVPRQPAVAPVSALCLGSYVLDLESLPGGMSRESVLQPPTKTIEIPAVLSYPSCPSLLLKAEGAGRQAAARVMQNAMLRLLTTFPPGKVRFTIIDPVGLGENFSAFMHLADYDERLVASRIWTDSAHIQQRLTDLTQHMEDVIQKYLRNEFSSIQEYNEHAGEVAEPYQILVVANFPANFSDEAARRLASIATSGARCGVFMVVSTDEKLKLPSNFEVGDLERQATTLVWNAEQSRFAWLHSELAPLTLTLESPPDDECFTAIVRAVGREAKEAARVEVPFESVLPAADAWWTADSRSEIEVSLGRAGAKKLQRLRLGKGTSQHVLIAGKTGSGKSTLLNALITNLAAYYSPDELHFYLIDFKKGVEFKAYATFRLPHARVIAIESEREFGLSVLERLDLELKRRGDLFRQQGVQDVAGFRNANPSAVMPRILLVIDEFQEFFTSDDKISHDASLLLDRLVRQGRAFGIHVLLGSQTLAGAYSLARSTIGQMAVRIALQCSESDAHLILSEDNTAARLLNRPGEAIYNDANGLVEGNHPFQIVWLPDHEREKHLRRLADLANGRGTVLPPPVVFEGNVAADPASNAAFHEVLHDAAPRSGPPRAWLGSPVAIKDPTAIAFERQPGSNLLVVGQNEELALGMLANCLLALAAQVERRPDAFPTFFVLDGMRPDSPAAGFWTRLRSQTTIDPRIVAPRDAGEVVRNVAAEVERRLAGDPGNSHPIFVFIHDLSRFRDLRKSDDFGLSFDEASSAGAEKQLATILREGPPVGVHMLVWADGLGTLNRWLERQSIRDFDLRALLQISAADSSQLMDSPAASRLGSHLALYYSEESGCAEKFRPYGVPSPAWLAEVSQCLTRGEIARPSLVPVQPDVT